ncbi:putative adenylosuccinate synthetase protein [Phaeoacremonium minimum UCRPA7]|uniref:Adenylosuccinate synthetase n=1 Tax=Phaeoacremonium minimum (strain UCR-PA7) TaxID=1286976 RepID=R8BH22_PHAM7|nr:putative adenylosuccinate synthetase protein [Phaeoacremonium minimum UCRPA7]EON98608.1 putative adenylosuccinate synthetase protein [Phaeoacremonium minimum UCRPA7]
MKGLNLIGSGVVFHVPSFFSELKELDEKGLPRVYDRILVSDRVHINLDLHLAVDGLEEIELGENKIGTTGRGIGPCYSTKAARSGIRLAEVFKAELFESKLRRLASGFAKRYGDLLRYDVEDEIARFREYRPKLARFVVDAVSFMRSAQEKNMNILVEGANMSGINNTTRVGMGSFKTEDLGEGRPLVDGVVVVGRLDLVVMRYSIAINYYTALNLTKLDVLDSFETIKIAVAYKNPETGEELASYPTDPDILDQAQVVYHEMPGWKRPTTNVKTFDDLPKQAQDYVEFIESFVRVKVKWIGTGPDRESMIEKSVV